jgi:hypothetical protein
MESSSFNNNNNDTNAVPSDMVVTQCIQKGLQDVILHTSIGLVVGGLMGIVLARGGSNAARKIYTGLGGGIGFGTAWTNTSIQLEELLLPSSSSSTKK